MTDEQIPLAKEGIPFFCGTGFVALISAICGAYFLTFVFALITFFLLYFFRDPERSFSSQKGGVISPADGKVVFLGRNREPEYDGLECFKISIFMSVFDVHVNRAPIDCTVMTTRYIPGRYLNAQGERSSKENERNILYLELDGGQKVMLAQVAGFIARRIVCRARTGDRLHQGERIGMIRMGSRVDIYLPSEFIPDVQIGSRVVAGQTNLGILP
jgi:phosphatidylserine decarboxylase